MSGPKILLAYAWQSSLPEPRPTGRPICLGAAIAILLSLTACDKPVVVNTVSDTFCTRVERFHATDAERAALKANAGPLERVIRWVAGINAQWDEQCLKPAKGA